MYKILLEIFGYIGTALVIFSMMQTSVVKLRIFNICGSVISMTYAIFCNTWPVVLLNFSLVAINVFQLIRSSRKRVVFDHAELPVNDGSVKHFFNVYGEDIKKYFPDFSFIANGSAEAHVVYMESEMAGVLIGSRTGTTLEVALDYSIPKYRDMSVGAFLYPCLRARGIDTLETRTGVDAHKKYLLKMGFEDRGGIMVKNLNSGDSFMKLIIDGNVVFAEPDKSLYEMVKELGLVEGKLSADPIAAKIAGRVFTLNYIPVRQKDVEASERGSVRKAMAASGGRVQLLRYGDPLGRDAYRRTAQFFLFMAIRRLWPNARATMNCTVGSGLYIKVVGAEDFSSDLVKEELWKIVAENIVPRRKRISTEEAIAYYESQDQLDKARLLKYRKKPTIDVYDSDGFVDYFYGEMAPSSSFLRSWDILPATDGFIFVFPDPQDPDKISNYRDMPNFFNVYTEGKRWGELMECENVADLNELVDSGKIRELIRVNEALHEKRFSQIADMICERGARAVMLAGPSSSGKTTSANRLATQLRGHGKMPILMSLDDYYIDRDKIAPGPDGTIDLEHINTIDTELFGKQLSSLLEGNEVELPSFNFKLGKREWSGHKLKLEEDSVIIIEGIHGLNPVLIPEGLDPSLVFRVYASPLLPLNLDDHNRIPSSYLRLLRRTVRDFETRGASVQRTLSMWDSVRRGEERWIFPFQENADVIFNSSTLYELAVLKKHIFPLLLAIEPGDDCYDQVRAMVKILNFVHEANVDDEIPPTSIVREFIGGNSFYR